MTEMERVVTKSAGETEALGESISGRLKEGDRVALVGELGGGKTRFVRGIARGLGSRGFIKSPSFTLVNVYEGGRLPLYHIDLYRIAGTDEVFYSGIEEYIYGKGISVIEWADKAREILSDCNVVVSFSYIGENEREIVLDWR